MSQFSYNQTDTHSQHPVEPDYRRRFEPSLAELATDCLNHVVALFRICRLEVAMNARTTWRCEVTTSVRHSAGRSFDVERSSNGNGTRTTFPRIFSATREMGCRQRLSRDPRIHHGGSRMHCSGSRRGASLPGSVLPGSEEQSLGRGQASFLEAAR